jgi:anti-sigma B factor antagonist
LRKKSQVPPRQGQSPLPGTFGFPGRRKPILTIHHPMATILYMELRIRKNQEIYIIDIQGELDLYNSYKLKELLTKMLEKKIERFVINLDEVEYIDSSGIGALIYISSTLKKLNHKLAITNIHGSVKKVIELTKLMGFFPTTETLDEAIKKVGA